MNRRYRLTVLSPTLTGSGELLTPIDYMVWQNEVRVLDQERIFKLLARNPRLESYLEQLRKADRLEWSQWGGYAQNYSSARIPFASGGLSAIWEKARTEDLHIPRFAHGGGRRLLPGSAVKGAFRTAWLNGALEPERARKVWAECAAAGLRWKTLAALDAAGGRKALDGLAFTDARTPADTFRVYQTRVLVLRAESKSGPSEWKPGQQFAEMAKPGAVFEGRGALPPGTGEALRVQARRVIAGHIAFARHAALKPLAEAVDKLRDEESRLTGDSAIFELGWGAGFRSKTLAPDLSTPEARMALTGMPGIRKSVVPGLPFPKTRRIAIDGGGGAALCGWVRLDWD
ncbi:MAG: type III-A CRISPR-associated RAMP protein Csm5 [Acidobacteria bacterium]|nr:type III-A CRISPR-associated RAMP protein Csm5 [Acidobacteriota bacterium]